MKPIKFILGFLILLVLITAVYAGENDPVCFGNTTTDTVCIGGDEGIVNATGEGHFVTVNTGQGNNELYAMDQDVESTDDVTFDNLTASTKFTDGTLTITGGAITSATDVNGSGELNFATINTGHGDQEVYGINTTVFVVQGDNIGIIKTWLDGLYCLLTGCTMSGNIAMGTNSITGATDINSTNIHTTNLYATNLESNLDGTGFNITAATLNTGQGANELYDMDQNVLQASDVTFDNVTVSTEFTDGTLTISSGSVTAGVDANFTGLGNFATVNTGHGAQEVYGLNTSAFVVQGDNIGVVLSLWNGLYCQLVGCTMAGDIAMGGSSITGALDVNGTGELNFATLNTGQGDNELYAMDQDVEQADAVTFATINTGKGAQEVYGQNTTVFVVQGNNLGVVKSWWDGLYCQLIGCTMAGDIAMGGSSVTGALDINATGKGNFATVNTGQGAYELYAMDQDVEQADAVTFATVDTGQGANELYDMNQNVLTTSAVTFDNVTGTIRIYVGGKLGVLTGSSAANNYLSVGNNMIYDGTALNILNASQNGSGIYFDNDGYIGFYSHDGSATQTLFSFYDDDIVGVNSVNATSVYLTENITFKCATIDNGAKIGNCG